MAKLWVIVFTCWLVAAAIGFFLTRAMGWEEITVYDHDWSSSSEVSVTPYSSWDSQRGSSYGYVYDYRPYYNWIPPAERELERQEIRREDWWGDEYKEWLYDQGLTRGDTIGW